ncbi:MAG: S-layer homology domain-containing protein [Oscillospiraceae bacterium]|nr:S-layer homology domain-containing protein [Oscillospiraceae bacterium]
MKQLKVNRSLWVRAMAFALAVTLVIPLFGTTQALEPEPGFVAPVTQEVTTGVTPAELDAMAIDPQSWRLSHDTRFPETTPDWDDYQSFNPHPIVNWNNVREEVEGYPQPVLPELPLRRNPRPDENPRYQMPERTLRSAFILVEFPDRPMISGLAQGSEIMGNPQVDTGIYGLEGEERAEALQDFWRDFINSYDPELNRGHNVTGAWLEYTAGLWEIDAEFHGPYLLPAFQFQLGSWWNSATPIAARTQRAVDYFGNFTFSQQFPAWGNALGSGGANSIGLQAMRLAAEDGVEFISEDGEEAFDFVFLVVAGYCQSPTWQEMGPMMFVSPYEDHTGRPVSGPIEANHIGQDPDRQQGSVSRSIADQERIYDPVTRRLIEGSTGYDFTGLAHINRILGMVEAPGFDIREEWPNFWMLNYNALWRHHVTADSENHPENQGAFLAIREGWEAANISGFIADWRAAHPDAWDFHNEAATGGRALTDAQIRDNFFRPLFTDRFSEEIKVEFTPDADTMADIAAAEALIAAVTTIPYTPPANPTAANLHTARSNAVLPYLRSRMAAEGLDVTLGAAVFNVVNNNTAGATFTIGVASGSSAFANDTIAFESGAVVRDGRAAVGTGFTFAPATPGGAARAFVADESMDELVDGDAGLVEPDLVLVNGHLHDVSEGMTISPALMESTAAIFAPETVAPRAFSAQQYTQEWLDFFADNDPATAQERLLELLHDAAESARTCTVNPYFQASNQRYIPWSSWYASANVWSSISTGNAHMNAHGINMTIPLATQGEGAAMAVYSHELGHAVHLPDNDNMVYSLTAANLGPTLSEGNLPNAIQSLPVRAQLGPWNIMARGAHVGYYGGHTRWNIPGIRAGSGGTGLMAGMRIGAGFTDLTVPTGPAPNTAVGPRNWLREDHQNSLDVRYVDYPDFRAGPPVIDEVFGRNIPVNRGFTHADGTPLVGREAIVIQGIDFRDQTPGLENPIYGTSNALRWGNNLLGVNLDRPSTHRDNFLRYLPSHPSSGQNIIDPDRWNWSIGGVPNIQLGGPVNMANHNVPWMGGATTATAGVNVLTGTPLADGLMPRQSGFTIDVVDRVGHDSFSPDHGVLISRTSHTNVVGVGSMDNAGIFLIDAHPGNLGLIQFREADGTPYMFMCDHHMQLATAAFRAGVHNNPYYYSDITLVPNGYYDDFRPSGRFLTAQDTERFGANFPADPRPGVAGHTVNEWVDEHNNFHFYILARNNHEGAYGAFLSYEIGVRNTAPGAYEVGGELALAPVGPPSAASPGNFAVQRFTLTQSRDASATDIVRIVLDGELAAPVMKTTDGGYEYIAHTRDQNVVILNNLFAIAPGETIEFDVFIRIPDDHTDTEFDTNGQLQVIANSETTPGKTDTASAALLEAHEAFMFGDDRGNFRPLANITRAEVATILARTHVEGFVPDTMPPGMSGVPFPDIRSHWARAYIAWAYDAGLVQGYQGYFRPNDNITRQELAAILARTGTVHVARSTPFGDAGTVSGWATDYVYTVYREGLMIGDNRGNFRPLADIMRAEVATAVNRMLGRIDGRDALAAVIEIGNLEDAQSFPDVAAGPWYYPSVLAATNNHRVTRCDDGAINWKNIIPQ